MTLCVIVSQISSVAIAAVNISIEKYKKLREKQNIIANIIQVSVLYPIRYKM